MQDITPHPHPHPNTIAIVEQLVGHLQQMDPVLATRCDAAATQNLVRQLTEIRTEIIEADFAPLKAADFIPSPRGPGVSPGAEKILYRLLTPAGIAKIVANYADDIPVVLPVMEEFEIEVLTVAAAYLWSWLDLQRSLLSGFPLSDEQARATRTAIVRKIDEIAAIGVPAAGIAGFVNHPSVPVTTVTTGDWATATAAEILADLLEWENAIISNTAENYYPDALLMPGSLIALLHKPFSTTDTTSIWKVFQDSSQLVNQKGGMWRLDRWEYLEDGGVSGADPIGIMYLASNDVVELHVPLEYQELPPQPENLTTKVPALGRVAGAFWKRPAAASYADNLGAP